MALDGIAQRWAHALDAAARALPTWQAAWAAREINTWCHHDLHAKNAMRRAHPDGPEHGRCVLIDLALVRPGHWIEDALYFERLHWGTHALGSLDPVETLARTRRFAGLSVADEYHDLARVRRALMAASAPAFIRTESNPAYLDACLAHLEAALI